MTKHILPLFLTTIAFLFSSFTIAQDAYKQAVENLIYMDNTSLDAIPGMSYVHMHNKKGIRVEYNINRQQLVLWTSPLAGKSIDGVDRNFSNRDDHTSIFDFIGFPELKFKDFIKCDYDPFYSKLFFKDNTLHILALADKSAVVLWFDHGSMIDIKSDKTDRVRGKTLNQFSSIHVERGKTFEFVAQLSAGDGKFVHQKVMDESRSFYSRAYLAKGQFIVFAGDVSGEQPVSTAILAAEMSTKALILNNENSINDQTKFGKIKIRSNPELQKIIDLNKRIIYAMQDQSGAMRAALRHIYYLIWHRDGGMVFSYNAYTGWADPLKKWCEFILANPTKNDKGERFWGQLVSPITKLEEDGPFYGIWSNFTYWTQTGDSSLLTVKNLQVMEDNLTWLENNYYDAQKGLFFRYHYCESPYYKSPGYGWDDAVGSQSYRPRPYKWKEDTITKAYDTYINNINYASYLMLGMMHNNPEKKNSFLSKARQLGEKMRAFYKVQAELPVYGELVTLNNKSIYAEAPGPDDTDYQWGFGLPFFYPDYRNLETYRSILVKQHMQKPSGQFLSGLFSNIMSFDPEIHGSEDIIKTIEYVIPQTIKSGRCLPMPYSIPEIVDVSDCNIYHDVRPQPFSISAYFATIANLGVRRLPFGIALRGTDYLDSIQAYQYKSKLLHIHYSGKGPKVKKITINGRNLAFSLQIPESFLTAKENKISVVTSEKEATNMPLWIGSSLTLLDIVDRKVQAKAYGHNLIMIKNAQVEKFKILLDGKSITSEIYQVKGITYVEFEGSGKVEFYF